MKNPTINSGEILSLIQDVWEDLRQIHPDIPEAVFTFGSGVRGKRMIHGHFASNTWKRDKETLHEVFIAGEGLARGAVELFGTLVHEAAHGIANTRSIKDTSRQGRYHNDKFREIGEELGLELSKDEKIGWSPTTVPEATRAEWAPQIEALERACAIWRLLPPPKEQVKKPQPVWICRCEPLPRELKISRKAAEEGPVMCGLCQSVFVQQEGGE